MSARPVLMVGLDGFDHGVANRLLAEGRLPALQRLTDAGATVRLDHGDARRTGLAWEHVSSGLSPDDARRWGAVDFKPHSYRATQSTTDMSPFLARMDVPAVVFDCPYFNLAKAKSVRGLVGWGLHDPGVHPCARPAAVLDEVLARFGPYPAAPWIYGFVWPSVDRTEEMSAALINALHVRSQVTQWLFGERMPEWDLGLVVFSEYHSAIEALWHGIDPDHPLYSHPSADAAKRGLEGVYEAGDRMLAELMDRFPDARLVVFYLHGMGPNNADIPSMLLLPELLYRDAFNKPLFKESAWRSTASGAPILEPDGDWHKDMAGGFPARGGGMSKLMRRAFAKGRRLAGMEENPQASLDWMPAAQYKRFWQDMPAFALPAYYDGRIRLNLKGRERHGVVPADAYESECARIEQLIRECRDPLTGKAVAAKISRPRNDKFSLGESDADIVLEWEGSTLGFLHPRLGQIGPVPYRRTGGHTGGSGVAYFSDPAGLEGVTETSAFDLVPTVIEMLGKKPVEGLSGASMMQAQVS